MITQKRSSKKRKRKSNTVVIIAFIVLVVIIYLLTSNKLYKVVTVEAGTKTPTVSQFIKNEKNQGTFKTDVSKIDMNTTGVHEIEIQIGKKVYKSKLKIEDTVAPKADIVNQESWAKEEIKAEKFVENIQDAAKVKVSFKEQPDFNKIGEQKVLILLEDTSENVTELEVPLTIKEDTESPTIKNAKDQTVYIGDKVSYKKNVEVTDNKDSEVELEVASDNVNLKKVGSYEVIYTATDSSGNKTTKTVVFKVKEKPKGYVSQEELDKVADEVLETITTESMSQKEVAKAIYNWTKHQIQYVEYENNTDWVKAAYDGIKKRRGDCYVYYATAQELLTRAGIENQPIIKTGKGHFWNLINLGNGWYHFDTTPRRAGGEFFMLTDAEIEEYSKNHKNSHVWDKSKYPATPVN